MADYVLIIDSDMENYLEVRKISQNSDITEVQKVLYFSSFSNYPTIIKSGHRFKKIQQRTLISVKHNQKVGAHIYEVSER